ncbi:MAG: hypothetical protein H6741_01995 [Alphaproteobacteria bacterium]|nr:hypothetical protein [Alphaproteobacteria bacterium]MCB9791475.1 hypothetical protein [Alphaproteobacteria bacterium]
MRPLLVLALGALLLPGCNNKIKKYHDKIDAMDVTHHNSAGAPGVALGRLEPVTDGAAAQGAAAGGNVAIEVFEVEMATRVAKTIQPDDLAKASGNAARKYMEESGPYPVSEESNWRLEITTLDWGITADVDQPAQAWVSLDASAYGPKGKRIWRRSLVCQQPLVPDLAAASDVTQTAVNIGSVRAMTDEELWQAFRAVSRECGREVGEKLNRTIAKAREKDK